ncbi:MAG: cytochrome c [Burkholderiales bacterium]|nr:cytochrome c [Burkholderiales bacterium]
MATIAHRLAPADIASLSQWLAAQPVPVVSAPATVPPSQWPLQCGALTPEAPAPSDQVTQAAAGTADIVTRGAYLARIGNCAGCHTAPGGARYAGGRGVRTPFGTAYAGNLTPDDATGIGRWTRDDFWRALHEGRAPDGRRLIPAFPYTSYTRVTRDDADAIYAYLRSLPAVVQAPRPQALRFPFGTQAALAAWQWLFFTPQAPRAAPLDRGEYLVRGLGHCDACHAPRNRWGAPADALTGGVIPGQGWYAPSLHPAASGSRVEDTVALLRTGRNAHGSVTGPMANVVRESTQFWTDADLRAAADYLASLAPAAKAGAAPSTVANDVIAQGERVYVERCADCHGRDGRGAAGAYPPLAGNPTVQASNADNLVQILRHGTFGPTTRAVPRPYGMPPADLDDVQAAALLSYIRQAWGNAAPGVMPVDVARTP